MITEPGARREAGSPGPFRDRRPARWGCGHMFVSGRSCSLTSISVCS